MIERTTWMKPRPAAIMTCLNARCVGIVGSIFLTSLVLSALDPVVAEQSAPPSVAPSGPSESQTIKEIDKVGGSSSTQIKFNIDKNGGVFGCIILEKSGSDYLDQEACRIMTEKAKFRPTKDEKGKRVPTYGKTVRIEWILEE